MSTLIWALLWALGAALALSVAAAVAERGKDRPDYAGWARYGLGTWTVMAAGASFAWLMGWWTP